MTDCDNNCDGSICLKELPTQACSAYEESWQARRDNFEFCDDDAAPLPLNTACAALGEFGTRTTLNNCAAVGGDLVNVYLRSDCACPYTASGLLVDSPPPPSPPKEPPPPSPSPPSPSPPPPASPPPCQMIHTERDIRGFDLDAWAGVTTDFECFIKIKEAGWPYGVRNWNTNVCMAKSEFTTSFNDHASAFEVHCGEAPPYTPPPPSPPPPSPSPPPPTPPTPPNGPPPLLPNQELGTDQIALVDTLETPDITMTTEDVDAWKEQILGLIGNLWGAADTLGLTMIVEIREVVAGTNETNATNATSSRRRRLQSAVRDDCGALDYTVVNASISSQTKLTRSQIDALLAAIPNALALTGQSLNRCGITAANYEVERIPMPPPPPPVPVESLVWIIGVTLGAMFLCALCGCGAYGVFRYWSKRKKEREDERDPLVRSQRTRAVFGNQAARPVTLARVRVERREDRALSFRL